MAHMSKPVYEAFKRVGADDETASAAALAVPSLELLATKGDIAEIKGEIAEIKGQIAELRGQIGDLKGEIGDLRGQIGELRGEIGDLKVQMGDIKVQMGAMQASFTRQLYFVAAGLFATVIALGLLG